METQKPKRKPIFRHSEDGSTPSDHDRLLGLAKANPGNVLKYNVGGGVMGHALAHENEAPFPLGLPEFLIRSFCPPGGVVCDPFTGSGTTGHAAILHGRRFVGCDLRPGKGGVETASRRLMSVTPGLFNDPITNVSEN